MIVIITDAAPSANSSTSREVQDFIDVCKLNGSPISVIHPSKSHEDFYLDVNYSITCKPIFYKSNNLILRLISEVLIALVLSIKILIRRRLTLNVTKILFISPSIFIVFPSVILKKITKSHLYLILRDMFPYWLVDIGKLNEGSIVFKLFKKIADFQMNSSSFIGVESNNSLDFFLKKYPQHSGKAEILWNWMTTEKVFDMPIKDGAPTKVIYAGSLGEAQGVDSFLALLKHWQKRSDIELHMVGRGIGIKKLINFSIVNNINNFYIHSEVESKNFDNFISQYDIGLFFLRHDLNASNIPGKFMSYVMNGLPVLGVINPKNELIYLVNSNELGYLDSSGSVRNFLNGADAMIKKYQDKFFSREKIQEKASIYFSTQHTYQKIMRLEK
jgi:glycosyltransferase involved in cell wall biosynthesis